MNDEYVVSIIHKHDFYDVTVVFPGERPDKNEIDLRKAGYDVLRSYKCSKESSKVVVRECLQFLGSVSFADDRDSFEALDAIVNKVRREVE